MPKSDQNDGVPPPNPSEELSNQVSGQLDCSNPSSALVATDSRLTISRGSPNKEYSIRVWCPKLPDELWEQICGQMDSSSLLSASCASYQLFRISQAFYEEKLAATLKQLSQMRKLKHFYTHTQLQELRSAALVHHFSHSNAKAIDSITRKAELHSEMAASISGALGREPLVHDPDQCFPALSKIIGKMGRDMQAMNRTYRVLTNVARTLASVQAVFEERNGRPESKEALDQEDARRCIELYRKCHAAVFALHRGLDRRLTVYETRRLRRPADANFDLERPVFTMDRIASWCEAMQWHASEACARAVSFVTEYNEAYINRLHREVDTALKKKIVASKCLLS